MSNLDIIDSVWACAHDDIKSNDIFELSGKVSDMIIKQSMNAGTLDNISCIFICFNNFNKLITPKLSKKDLINYNKNTKKTGVFNIKNEYNEMNINNIKNTRLDYNYNSENLIIEEIRKKLINNKESSVKLRENEYIYFSDKGFDKKPKTSSEIIKKERFLFNGDNINNSNINDIEYRPVVTNTESAAVKFPNVKNCNNESDDNNDNHFYKVVSKKLKTTIVNMNNNNNNNNNNYNNNRIKNYEINLPNFKLPQKINNYNSNLSNYTRFNKEGNLRKISPIDKIGNFHNGFNSTNNNINNNNSINSMNVNMDVTSKTNNRFLPNIKKNIGSATLYNKEKKNNNNNNNSNNNEHGNFRINKPLQLNFNYK
jgi:hypothetical protein